MEITDQVTVLQKRQLLLPTTISKLPNTELKQASNYNADNFLSKMSDFLSAVTLIIFSFNGARLGHDAGLLQQGIDHVNVVFVALGARRRRTGVRRRRRRGRGRGWRWSSDRRRRRRWRKRRVNSDGAVVVLLVDVALVVDGTLKTCCVVIFGRRRLWSKLEKNILFQNECFYNAIKLQMKKPSDVRCQKSNFDITSFQIYHNSIILLSFTSNFFVKVQTLPLAWLYSDMVERLYPCWRPA